MGCGEAASWMVRSVARGECGEVASGGEKVASGGARVASGGAWGVPAIHRGQLPPPECLTARGSAHDGTNLLHRGQQPHSKAPLRQVVAHGELQELPEEDLLGEETVGEGNHRWNIRREKKLPGKENNGKNTLRSRQFAINL